ncbi:MAG TPA: response regulator [Thermoanaerobaculia bacterium]
MARPLRVLLVEDSERDAALLRLYLRRGGYDPDVQQVDTRAQLAAQLQAGPWDIVVSDFNLPGFDAFDARKMVLESARELPFIVLSADFSPAMTEQMAAAGIRYVCKYEIRSIIPIIDDYMRDRS